MRKKVALAVAALLLTACTPAFGTAAVVGDQKISISSVQESVSQIINQRSVTGEPDTGDVGSGQLAQDQTRFQIVSIVYAKAAKKVGVTVSPAELEAYRSEIIRQVGGEKNLIIPLTQNSIARKDFDLYLYDLLYQKKMGEKLVAGDATDKAVVDARVEAVNKVIRETFTENKVTVNPRYGIFDESTLLITTADYTNGALRPRG